MTEDRSPFARIAVLLSAVPIALIANILRITATAWAYHLLGAARGEKIAHDLAGWAMMPVALALVLIELKVLDWLIVPDDRGSGPPPLWDAPGPTRQPA
jgi:exosortase/archaeosortase family protein